jgi:hypothetical protein
LAHAKTARLTINKIKVIDDNLDQYLGDRLKDDWQKYCTVKNAQVAHEDIANVANQIYEQCKISEYDKIRYDYPFRFGLASGSATLKDN